MGNRSRYVTITAAAVGGAALVARRRARLRRMAEGIRDTIQPSHLIDLRTEPAPAADEAHAPGHQHLAPEAPVEAEPVPLRSRPWRKHGHGMHHPYSGS